MSRPVLQAALRVPLDRFDLEVSFASEARCLGVFGPSGSGKTTLLEAVAGLRARAHGTLCCGETCWLQTEKGIRLPPEKRGIGYVPQEGLLFPHKSVRGNLRAGLRRAGARAEGVWEEVVDVLELGPLLDRRVSSLSGGERQRVALGRALCSGPRLLLLDEPLSGLDHALRRRILPFLVRVRERFALPMLIVSHEPLELQALCDEVIALREGKLLAQGSPVEVFATASVYRVEEPQGFVNVMPVLAGGGGGRENAVRLGGQGEGPLLRLAGNETFSRGRVFLSLPARDILLATRAVEGTSARNRLAATVESLEPTVGRVLVRTRPEGPASLPPLVAEVTPEAVHELGLECGRGVHLLIKSSALEVLG